MKSTERKLIQNDTDIMIFHNPLPIRCLSEQLQDAELHPLADITNKEIEEVKHLKHPPREVARVMEVVHLLLTQPTSFAPCDWHDVLRTVVRIDFLKRARSINLDGVLQQAKLIDYVCRKSLSSELNKDLNKEHARFLQDHVCAYIYIYIYIYICIIYLHFIHIHIYNIW